MYALGYLGLSLDYLYNLTPRQYSNTLRGFVKRERDRSQEDWYRVRKMMVAFLAPYSSGADALDEKKILPFPWEENAEDSSLTDAEALQKVADFWAKRDADRAEKLKVEESPTLQKPE